MTTVNDRRFYVYAYLRTDGTPYYIGKGTGKRIDERHSVAMPPKDRRKLLIDKLTDPEAIEYEIALIYCLGRKNLGTGCLRNLTDGGEGLSGYQYTEDLRSARAAQLTGNNYGSLVEWTPELRAHLSRATTGVLKTRTPCLLARHQEMERIHRWEHPDHGTHTASASGMGRKWGGRESFGKLSRGKAATHKGWICLDPLAAFSPAETDHDARINKAAETRTKKNAAQLGMSVEEYRALSYQQRSALRKSLGLKEATA